MTRTTLLIRFKWIREYDCAESYHKYKELLKIMVSGEVMILWALLASARALRRFRAQPMPGYAIASGTGRMINAVIVSRREGTTAILGDQRPVRTTVERGVELIVPRFTIAAFLPMD